MKRFICGVLLLLACVHSVHSQQAMPNMGIEVQLGDSSFVSLLTCGPGDEFYTTFGHSALRICDTTVGLDVVYNYGCFSFTDGMLFYLRFAQGDMRYHLARYSMVSFMNEYYSEGRWVEEQVLDLTVQERNNLLAMLEFNYQPDYRYYQYDFFRDNCATRVRDMICNCLNHRTVLKEEPAQEGNLSYRKIIHPYMVQEHLLWWQMGLDIILGYNIDKPCTTWEYMFAPSELMYQIDSARFSDTGSLIVKDRHMLLEQQRPTPSKTVNPTLVFWLLFMVIIGLTWGEWKKGWHWLTAMDVLLFLVAALLSLLIVFLWFFSLHYCTRPNWNLLWASPLFFYFLFAQRKSNKWMVMVQLVALLVVVSSVCWMPQQLPPAVVPISLMLFVRLLSKIRR